MRILQTFIFFVSVTMVASTYAVELLDYLTDKNGQYIGPTVEERIAEMDADNNGFADVYEVRAYLEKQHGEGYQKEILGRWQANANPNSCGAAGSIEDFVAKQ